MKQLFNAQASNRLAGIGAALSALDSGNAVDLSGFIQNQQAMQQQAPMGGGGGGSMGSSMSDTNMLEDEALMANFTPEQRTMLAQMPRAAAMKIIEQSVFVKPDPAAAWKQNLQQTPFFQGLTPQQQAGIMMLPPAEAQSVMSDMLFKEKAEKELPASVQALEWRAQQAGLAPGTPEYIDFIKKGSGGGQTFNIGDGGAQLPQGVLGIDEKTGLMVIADPESPLGVRQVPIPGGKADVERAAAASAAEAEEKAEAERLAKGEDGAAIKSNAITNAVDNIIQADSERVLTGAAGEAVSGLGGTSNREIMSNLSTLQGAGAFAALQSMREASKTGGALGAVSERELALLVGQAGALDPTSKNFRRDLENYEKNLLETIHGVEEGQRLFEENQARRGGSEEAIPTEMPEFLSPQDAELWDYFTDEEKAAILKDYEASK